MERNDVVQQVAHGAHIVARDRWVRKEGIQLYLRRLPYNRTLGSHPAYGRVACKRSEEGFLHIHTDLASVVERSEWPYASALASS